MLLPNCVNISKLVLGVSTRSPNFLLQQKLAQRSYHSEKGVYGYRPLPKREFKISDEKLSARNSQPDIVRWVEGFRKHGHRLASIDPVNFKKLETSVDELSPAFYGLQSDTKADLSGIADALSGTKTIAEIEELLKKVYCGPISAEFSFIQNLEEREWLAARFEALNDQYVENKTKKEFLEILLKNQLFDNFLAVKFPTVKRYGGEGAEGSMVFYKQLLESAVEDELQNIVIGMQHRGRLNLLTTTFQVPPVKLFHKLQGNSEFPDDVKAMSDVIMHYHVSDDITVNGKSIHVNILRNPSHLEVVNAVSMGKTRSKQQSIRDGAYGDDAAKDFSTTVLNVQVHGDAAFTGQGINQECLMTARVPHFNVGGSIHLVVNNQVGFTTPADRGRSTRYVTDLAKSIDAPIFHVNGDDPESVFLVTKVAFDYQRTFRKDVFIDLNCFRRWGHNELDDPTFTNPALYSIIHNRRSVPDLYAQKLVEENVLDAKEIEDIKTQYNKFLNDELESTSTYTQKPCYYEKQWSGFVQAPNSITVWDTGLDYSLLAYIGNASVHYPPDFNIHPHLLKTHVSGRLKKIQQGQKIDWATAEALAIGSLMYQGHNVRISGEDVGRGTFSHRHVMLVDQKTNEMFIPLNSLKGGLGGKLEIANSILSEEAVLGYEYGMAIDNPNNLIIWEAQFGDFHNGAQIIFDTFIASGETKWMESNGLVVLLPHGYDGVASEHSSCRIERFLQLTDSRETAPDGDDINLHVINPTTPAQYYHALRRQILRNFRKPLIVVAPKVLLRLSDATSSHDDLAPGTHFKNVIGDDIANVQDVRKVIFCSGKHYYNLNSERLANRITDVAIIRLESLAPFPIKEIQTEIAKYKNCRKFIWSQEEARNMGAWSFVRPRFEYLTGKAIIYSGREEAPTAATGIGKVHRIEAEQVAKEPFQL
ncbi:probable 2-oxoglutarate dehydrogenase E1 component DHKTD1 homolog, mitochondrial [Hermetia illucens]|nr:probable 2-oxoglutarate dehydrogenase E1 component DHKTD1 homolog, mitochondrial [Hermetia illucens]XP_037921993.1 probable 2-oxoglutarate dehydrogenase E1 component DHKTD1 homolog, mitochondrial [Hermetia illucens]